MVERRIPVAERCMKAPRPQRQRIAERVADLGALEVDDRVAAIQRLEVQLDQRLDKVLDLSAYIAGPYGCSLLADQGAEVIKIEPPAGDNLRKYPRRWKPKAAPSSE